MYPCCLVTYILHLHAVRPTCFSAASYMMMHITRRKEKMKYLQGINYLLRNGKLLPFSLCGLICIAIFATLKLHTKCISCTRSKCNVLIISKIHKYVFIFEGKGIFEAISVMSCQLMKTNALLLTMVTIVFHSCYLSPYDENSEKKRRVKTEMFM